MFSGTWRIVCLSEKTHGIIQGKIEFNMVEEKKSKKDKIQKDIELITKILEKVEIQNKTMRELVFEKFGKSDFFETQLGIAFLDSLLKEKEYNKAKIQESILQDLRALKRMLDYLEKNRSSQVIEKLKTYPFANAWIQEFALSYLNGTDNLTKAVSGVYKEEREDLKVIYNLLEKVTGRDTEGFDRLYQEMITGETLEFKTWLGHSFFQEIKSRTTEEKRKKRRKRCFEILGQICFIAAFFLALFGIHQKEQSRVDRYLTEILQARQETENKMQEIGMTESLAEEEDYLGKTENKKTESKKQMKILPQYQKFYQKNKDLRGWLKIENTEVNYPVLQREEEDDYYLNHNFQGEDSQEGSLFIDGMSSVSPQNQNLVIYGHNMKSGAMFGTLKNYKNYHYFLEHPVFSFDTLYEEQEYQIVTVFITDVSQTAGEKFCYYQFWQYKDQEEFERYKNFLKDTQLYDSGYELEYGDTTVMLSTCEASSKNSRLVVVGKRMK